MLEFELLEKLVTYAEKKGSSLGKKLEYSIATNFTLLSQKNRLSFVLHRFWQNNFDDNINIDVFSPFHCFLNWHNFRFFFVHIRG